MSLWSLFNIDLKMIIKAAVMRNWPRKVEAYLDMDLMVVVGTRIELWRIPAKGGVDRVLRATFECLMYTKGSRWSITLKLILCDLVMKYTASIGEQQKVGNVIVSKRQHGDRACGCTGAL